MVDQILSQSLYHKKKMVVNIFPRTFLVSKGDGWVGLGEERVGQSTWQTGWIRLWCSGWCEQPGTLPAGISAVLIRHPCGLPDGVWPTHRAREQVQVTHYSTVEPPTFSGVFSSYFPPRAKIPWVHFLLIYVWESLSLIEVSCPSVGEMLFPRARATY